MLTKLAIHEKQVMDYFAVFTTDLVQAAAAIEENPITSSGTLLNLTIEVGTLQLIYMRAGDCKSVE